jgi:hypothetical protein
MRTLASTAVFCVIIAALAHVAVTATAALIDSDGYDPDDVDGATDDEASLGGAARIIKVPEKLRPPIGSVWTATFHPRNLWATVHPMTESQHHKGVPRVRTQALTSGTSHMKHEEGDPYDPTWSGRPLEFPKLVVDMLPPEDNLALSEEERRTAPFNITAWHLTFNEHAFALPCFSARIITKERFTVGDADTLATTSREISPPVLRCPEPWDTHFTVALQPPTWEFMKEIYADTTYEPLSLVVEVQFEEYTTTTFVYDAPNGLGREVVESGDKYDVTPQNASMAFKFMLQFQPEHIEVWAFRKPPMPCFRLLMMVDGTALISSEVVGDWRSPSAYGVRHGDVEQMEDRRKYLDGHVKLVAIFAEPRRETIAYYTTQNLYSTLEGIVLQSRLSVQATGDYSAVSAKDRQVILPTNVPGVAVVLRYYPRAGFVGLYVRFPHAVKNVLVTVYRFVDSQPVIYLREGDAVVPMATATADAASKTPIEEQLLYGWDDALIFEVHSDKDPQSLLKAPFRFEVQFDNDTAEGQQVATLVDRWISSTGGSTEAVDYNFVNTHMHSHEEPQYITARRNIREGEPVVTLSYYNIFGQDSLEDSGWAPLIHNLTDALDVYVAETGMHPESKVFFMMTLAAMSHVYDSSHNYRVLFRLFDQTALHLPPLYNKDEVALFEAFSEGFAVERARALDLWEKEYEVLDAANKAGLLRRQALSREDYFHRRSQVECRTFNLTMTGVTFVPVVDLAGHSDDPNAALTLDESTGLLHLRAKRDIAEGDQVTIDFDAGRVKTKLAFLIQHGFVPSDAAETVVVSGATLLLPQTEAAGDEGVAAEEDEEEQARQGRLGQLFELAHNERDSRGDAVLFLINDARHRARDAARPPMTGAVDLERDVPKAELQRALRAFAHALSRKRTMMPVDGKALAVTRNVLPSVAQAARALLEAEHATLAQHVMWAEADASQISAQK